MNVDSPSRNTHMNFQDYFVNLILSGVMIIGAYQFYFYTQRHPLRKEIVWNSPIDEKIPFRPRWSWIYSFLYYPAILYLNIIATDHRHFNMMAFSFLMLLFMQMLFFWLFPVSTPRIGAASIPVKHRPNGFYSLFKNSTKPATASPVCTFPSPC